MFVQDKLQWELFPTELEKPGQKLHVTGKTIAIEGRLGRMGISVGCNVEKTWGGEVN